MATTQTKKLVKNLAGYWLGGVWRPFRNSDGYDPALAGDLDTPAQRRARRAKNTAKADKNLEAQETASIERDIYGDADSDKKGKTLAQFVRAAGGLKITKNDAGELALLSSKESGKRGLVSKTGGKTLDYMYQSALESGYPLTDLYDLLDKLDDEISGGKETYATHGSLSYRDNPAAKRAGKNSRQSSLKFFDENEIMPAFMIPEEQLKNARFKNLRRERRDGNDTYYRDSITGRRYLVRDNPALKINPGKFAVGYKVTFPGGKTSRTTGLFQTQTDADKFASLLKSAKPRGYKVSNVSIVKSNPATLPKTNGSALLNFGSRTEAKAAYETAAKLANEMRKVFDVDGNGKVTKKDVEILETEAKKQTAKPKENGVWSRYREGRAYKRGLKFQEKAEKEKAKRARIADRAREKKAAKSDRERASRDAKRDAAQRRREDAQERRAQEKAQRADEKARRAEESRAAKQNPSENFWTQQASRLTALVAKWRKEKRPAAQIKKAETLKAKALKMSKGKVNATPYRQNGFLEMFANLAVGAASAIQVHDRLKSEKKTEKPANKKVAKKVAKVKKNSAAYEAFQGRPTEKTLSLETPETAPVNLYCLGTLFELKIKGISESMNFRREHTGRDYFVCAHENNPHQLWIAGGKSGATDAALKRGYVNLIGEIVFIVYETQKAHLDDDEPTGYIHHFGEEGGARPTLALDRNGFAIVEGGDYIVTPFGIKN